MWYSSEVAVFRTAIHTRSGPDTFRLRYCQRRHKGRTKCFSTSRINNSYPNVSCDLWLSSWLTFCNVNVSLGRKCKLMNAEVRIRCCRMQTATFMSLHFPFTSVSRFNLDFRESKPKLLSPNSFYTMAEISPTMSLYLFLEVPESRKTRRGEYPLQFGRCAMNE